MHALKICSLFLSIASAANAADAPRPANAPTAQPPAANSGMRAHIDPKTGELTETPTAPQRPERSTFDASKVEEIRHADGMVEYRFNGQADSTQTAQVDADGKLAVRCAEHGVQESHDDHH